MSNYIERPRECEAKLVTGDNAADVVAWLGGPDLAMALSDGSVLFQVGGVWLTAPVGHYIALEHGQLTAHPADDFERDWTLDEGE